jgi:hypothetical protein
MEDFRMARATTTVGGRFSPAAPGIPLNSAGGEEKANGNIPELEFAATGEKQRDMQILIATQNTISAARLSMRSLRGKAEKGDRVHG